MDHVRVPEYGHDADWGFLCPGYLHDAASVTEGLKEVEEALESTQEYGWTGIDGGEFRENACAAFPYELTGQLQDHHHKLREAFVERLCMCRENAGFSRMNKGSGDADQTHAM
jgi:hypothetical protein